MKPNLCGDCPDLRSETKTDVYPPQKQFWCGKVWLGFLPSRHSECRRELEEDMPLFAGGTDGQEAPPHAP